MPNGIRVLKFGGEALADSQAAQTAIEIINKEAQGLKKTAVVCTPSRACGSLINEAASAAAQGKEEEMQNKLGLFRSVYQQLFEETQTAKSSKTEQAIGTLLEKIDRLLYTLCLKRQMERSEKDLLFGLNGQITAHLFAEMLRKEDQQVHRIEAPSIIKTNSDFGSALIDTQKTHLLIQAAFTPQTDIFVIPGGMGSNVQNQMTYLGRNGSEYTAATIAAAMDAGRMTCYTNKDGIMTANPAYVPNAFTLPEITYNETLEMSYLGMQPLYAPALHPAISAGIPIWFRNLYNPEANATRIADQVENDERQVRGIVSLDEVSLLHLKGTDLPRLQDVSSRFQAVLEQLNISIPFFAKPFSGHSITAAVRPKAAGKALKALESAFEKEIQSGRIDGVDVEENLSLVAIVGEGMRDRVGVSGKLFHHLGRNGINIHASAQGTSQMNHSVVIRKNDLSKALNVLHEVFFLSDSKSLNIFLVGPGLIGSTLVKQIDKQKEFLKESRNVQLRIVGVANSKKMLFDPQGIEPIHFEQRFEGAKEPTVLSKFVEQMIELNLPNTVFVDATASEEPVEFYEQILSASIAIVTPNKRANSGPFERYVKLKGIAMRHSTQFLYETNVGAGLPIVNTLNDLYFSGDQIKRIDAILSGTISYIFNTFSKETSFAQTVREAKEQGFTEPDPREDLNGKDMARKILILAREIGYSIEPADIEIEQILPDSAAQAASVEEFFQKLEEENAFFEQMRENAEKENKKLRFIGTVEEGKVYVKLDAVGQDHPFYNMQGADNIISFVTERYKEDMPLLVRGPGAGAEVTAAGVFAEIIELSKF